MLNKLATLSGMNHSTLDNIMRENTKIPKIRTIHRLARGLEMTLTEFFDFPEINEALLDDEYSIGNAARHFRRG